MPIQHPTVSIQRSIQSDIENKLLNGEWPPGHRIPSEVELKAAYGCSRMTVNKVLSELARVGMIERRRRAGSFVTRIQSRSAVLQILDVKAEVLALGHRYRMDLVERVRRRSTKVDAALIALPPGSPVLELTCVHHAGASIFCQERRLINLTAVPAASAEDFAEKTPGGWLIEQVPWTSAEHTIMSKGADRQTADALKLALGSPCLVVERRTWLGNAPVTWVRLAYPAEQHVLVARFTPSQGV